MYATIILSESNNSAVTYVGNFLGNLPARRPIHPISQLKIPFLYLIHILLRLNSLFIQIISIPFNSQYHYCSLYITIILIRRNIQFPQSMIFDKFKASMFNITNHSHLKFYAYLNYNH